MSGDMLRVGLVGAGPWAHRVHAPGIAGHPRTSLAAVWAPASRRRPPSWPRHTGRSRRPTSTSCSARSTRSPSRSRPPCRHRCATKAAVAGKHLILEKPVAPTVRDAEVLADAVARAGVTSMMVLTFRYATATRGWLDAVHEVDDWVGGEARWFSGTLLDAMYEGSQWRHDGGALADIGPHVFDLLDAALGTVKSVELARFTAPGLWHVMLGHDGGRLSTATLSMHTPAQPAITDFAVHGPRGFLPSTPAARRPTATRRCSTTSPTRREQHDRAPAGRTAWPAPPTDTRPGHRPTGQPITT